MSEGWKQVWDDVRTSLRGPAHLDRSRQISGEQAPARGLSIGKAVASEDGPASLAATLTLDSPPLEHDRTPAHVLTRRWGRWAWAAPVVIAGLFVVFLVVKNRATAPIPPAPNVVATYMNGQITVEDVRRHLAVLLPEQKGKASTPHTAGEYRLLVEDMLTDKIVRTWASERKADTDDKFRHAMKHISEEINLDELHQRLHKGQMGVAEGDIQAYFDANRPQFGDKTLSEVSEEIRARLKAQQEDKFVENYLAGLKQRASISRYSELLTVPDPTDEELAAYFAANSKSFTLPDRANVNEIAIPFGKDEEGPRRQAEAALTRLRSGEAFGAVAREVSPAYQGDGPLAVIKGQRPAPYDEIVFGLDQDAISDVIRAGDKFYIVRLRSSEPARQQTLDEVKPQIRQAVLAEKEAAWFKEKASRALFVINGEQFTIGEFWQEYGELPPAFAADYQGVKGRAALAERLIERLLLLDDSYDQLLDVSTKDELEETRLRVLGQIMEQELVDDAIEITDKNLEEYYQAHSGEFLTPPKARIRYILIRLGQTDDEHKRAWEKANEAYRKLVPGYLQKGADFGEVARGYSEDQATAPQGGEMKEWLAEGTDLLSELGDHPFHQQVFALAKGEISRPFEWLDYIYILQVLDRTESRALSFEEAKKFLRDELRAKKHDELAKQLSERLLKEAQLTIYDTTLRDMAAQEKQS